MSAGTLVTAMSLEDYDGSIVDLMVDPIRLVTSVAGLVGVSAREVVSARSGRSGSRNRTRYRDDRPIVIQGIINGLDADSTWTQFDVVAGAMSSAIDNDRVLRWTAGSSLALQQLVRLSALEEPLEVGPDIIRYQATFRASSPNVYSQQLKSATATPLGSTSGGGLVFPEKIPIVFEPSASTVAAFTNAGFVSTPPVFTLTGYVKDPVIMLNPTTQLVLAGEIAAGDSLVIDVDARTVTLNNTANRRSMLNTSLSTWFDLPRGSGTVTLLAEAFTPGATLAMTWRDARN